MYVRVATTGVKLNTRAPHVENPPPALGQDNTAIWGAMGLSKDDLARLTEKGII